MDFFFCDVNVIVPFDLRSRHMVDISQCPEISGNGRGSGHARLGGTCITCDAGNGMFRPAVVMGEEKKPFLEKELKFVCGYIFSREDLV